MKTNRRNFFAALVALPAAFKAATMLPVPKPLKPPLDLKMLFKEMPLYQPQTRTIDIFTDRHTAKKINEMMAKYYQQQVQLELS